MNNERLGLIKSYILVALHHGYIYVITALQCYHAPAIPCLVTLYFVDYGLCKFAQTPVLFGAPLSRSGKCSMQVQHVMKKRMAEAAYKRK
jgi:hypothetical protein